MPCILASRVPDNLQFWLQAGAPWRWVEAHGGHWNHQDWLELLAELAMTISGPVDPDAVGYILEETRRQRNLQRWLDSGEPAQWADRQRGRWNHADWLALLDGLRHSAFWPLDPDAVGLALEGFKAGGWNLRRWQESGGPYQWVRTHGGHWDHADWLLLLETLQRSEYWPLDVGQVGLQLEEARRCWENLCRWQQSGELLRWVRARQGQWNQADWLALLAELSESACWPVDASALGLTLEVMASEERNLRRWQEAGEAWRWVEHHQGQWNHADWLTLLGTIQWSGLWPVDIGAVGQVVEEARAKWCDLRRGQQAGQAVAGMSPSPVRRSSETGLSIREPQRATEPARGTSGILGRTRDGCSPLRRQAA